MNIGAPIAGSRSFPLRAFGKVMVGFPDFVHI
jgi:hypothetical protein